MEKIKYEYDEVYTVADFARIFKFSESAVRALIRQKKINAIKIGSRYRIPRKTFDQFFSQANLRYEDVVDECYGMWEGRQDIKDGLNYVKALRSR